MPDLLVSVAITKSQREVVLKGLTQETIDLFEASVAPTPVPTTNEGDTP